MVSLPCSRCGYGLASGEAYGAVHCGKCGLFKPSQPIATSDTISMTSFLCKDCGQCVFTNALPVDKRCFQCLTKASPPVGAPVAAPKESGAPARTPHRCPVCEGRGAVPTGFYLAPETHSTAPKQCRSCKGAGLVWSP